MAKGRPRKQGKRDRSGRLVRDPETRYDKGNDRVRAMRETYGEHYSSPIGRAFVKGFLGTGQIAQDRLHAGKAFARAYNRFINQDRYRCPLNDTPRGGEHPEPESTLDALQWLFSAMDKIREPADRKYLDQLLSPEYTDQGPFWLEALIAGKPRPTDHAKLACALAALDALAPKRKPMGILVAIRA